jgi:probable HAF family extracellular repeat protein
MKNLAPWAAVIALLSFPRVGQAAGTYFAFPFSSVLDVSTDGSLALASRESDPEASFLWSEKAGEQRIPGNFGHLSDDGRYLLGDRVWRRALVPPDDGSPGQYADLDLGDLPGGRNETHSASMSADGSIVVGRSNVQDFPQNGTVGFEAFRWTQAGGIESLGDLPGDGDWSYASSISADGAVIVGTANVRPAEGPASGLSRGGQAFRWTSADGIVGLGFLDGPGHKSEARAVSADGQVVVGHSDHRAFYWTPDLGMVDITPPDSQYGEAYAVSPDGRIVFMGAGPLAAAPYVWDAVHGPRSFADFAKQQGFVHFGATSAPLFAADDGRLIFGGWFNLFASAWGVRLDTYWPETLTPGDIDLDNRVGLSDFGIMKQNFGSGVFRYQGDLNEDRQVDLTDFGLLKANFTGDDAAVPEPPTLVLALAAVLAGGAVLRTIGPTGPVSLRSARSPSTAAGPRAPRSSRWAAGSFPGWR